MVNCLIRLDNRVFAAQIAQREAVAGNVILYRGRLARVVIAPPEWWTEGQRA
jgi:hypothetical protein